jgi:hypothetical protein
MHAQLARALALALVVVVDAGCLSTKYQARTDVAGPVSASGTAPARGEPEVWIASAPAGVLVTGDVVSVAPEARDDYELVGRTKVERTLEQDPGVPTPLMFNVVAASMSFLILPCAPFGFGWLAYAGSMAFAPIDREQALAAMKREAKKQGADAIVYVEMTEERLGFGTIGRGFLLRRRKPAAPAPAAAPDDVAARALPSARVASAADDRRAP